MSRPHPISPGSSRKQLPEWLTEEIPEPVYTLWVWLDGDTLAELNISRAEFLQVRDYIGHLRGLLTLEEVAARAEKRAKALAEAFPHA